MMVRFNTAGNNLGRSSFSPYPPRSSNRLSPVRSIAERIAVEICSHVATPPRQSHPPEPDQEERTLAQLMKVQDRMEIIPDSFHVGIHFSTMGVNGRQSTNSDFFMESDIDMDDASTPDFHLVPRRPVTHGRRSPLPTIFEEAR